MNQKEWHHSIAHHYFNTKVAGFKTWCFSCIIYCTSVTMTHIRFGCQTYVTRSDKRVRVTKSHFGHSQLLISTESAIKEF